MTMTSDFVTWISDEYYGLNGSSFDILDAPPSALEFSRLARISRPVLVKGYRLPATERWTNDYLTSTMGAGNVSIAITPDGHADAITCSSDGKLYFVEPCVEQMTMEAFLERLRRGDSEIAYLQSQNGNIYSASYFQDQDDCSEFDALRSDIPCEIPWCSEALGYTPDAVNLWIGSNKSVTSIHSDPYENVYHVVRGVKHFTLIPPTEAWALREKQYPHATYTRADDGALQLSPSDPSTPPVRWSSILNPHEDGSLPPGAHPLHITVSAGETLYLPAGWWHHVRQSGDVTVALNWWYDIEMRGMQWVWLSFLREHSRGRISGEGGDDSNTASSSHRSI